MSQNKKQHYVPQFYLKKFSDNGRSVWTYDKVLGKVIQPSISNICCEKDLYTISDEMVSESISEGHKVNKLSFEKDFFANALEQNYSRYWDLLVDMAKLCIDSNVCQMPLSDDDKIKIAYYIAIQFLRLPQIKEYSVEIFNDTMPKIVRLFTHGLAKETNNPDLLKHDIETSIRDKSVYHAQTAYLDMELVEKYTLDLCNNIWTFAFSTDNKFYTSDFPICVNTHKKDVRQMNMGLTQEGAELTFPISKRLMLTIWDKKFFYHKVDEDMSISISSDKEIRALNLIRYMQAKRQIYSYENDFTYIQFVVNCRNGKQYYMNPFS